MAKINGTSFLLLVDGTAIGSTRTCSIDINVDTPDTTTKDSGGYEQNLPGGGLRGATISFDGLEDPANTLGVDELFDLINNRADFDFQITTSSAGDKIWTGTATMQNLSQNYEMEQPVSVSGTAKVNGTLVRATET